MKYITIALISLLLVSTVSAFAFFGFIGDINVSSTFDENVFETSIGVAHTTYPINEITNHANNTLMVELLTNGGTNVIYHDEDGLPLSDLDDDGLPELIIPVGGTSITVSSETTGVVNTTFTTPEDVDFINMTSKELVSENTYMPTDDMIGYLIYEQSSSDFNFCLKAEKLETSTEYSLIYYVDQPDRFDAWGGVYPSKTIISLRSGEDFESYHITNKMVFTIGEVAIGHSLPHPDYDTNAYTVNHDYRGAPNYYKYGTGAKMWLIPNTDLNDDPVKNSNEVIVKSWNPDDYLFEDGLVNYEDIDGEASVMNDPVEVSVNFVEGGSQGHHSSYYYANMIFMSASDEFEYTITSDDLTVGDYDLGYRTLPGWAYGYSQDTIPIESFSVDTISGFVFTSTVNLDVDLIKGRFILQSINIPLDKFVSDESVEYIDTDK